MKFFRLGFLSVFLSILFVSNTGSAQSDNKRGERVYKLCTYCHGDQGQGRQELAAPAIAGLPEWYLKRQLTKFNEGVRGTHPQDLAGMRMRAMGMALYADHNDIEAVSKHVAALPRTKHVDTVRGRVLKGEAAYQVCIACHGAKGEGNESVGGPPLVGASDWYLVTQLHHFKSGVRAGNPERDPTGSVMRGMAATLSAEGVDDVVAYINLLNQQKQ